MEYSRNNKTSSSKKSMNTRLFDREMGDLNYKFKYMNPVNRMEIERDEFMKNSNLDSDEDDLNEMENNNFDKRMPSRDGYNINKPIYTNENSNQNKLNKNRMINSYNQYSQYSDFADINADTKLSDNINTTKICINGINNYGLFLFDNMLNMMNSAFIFSPYLIYSIFASLFIASDGNTEIELKNYFNFPRTDQLSSGLQELRLNIKTMGNCIIFSQDIDYNPQFCKNINTFTKIRKVNPENSIAETDDVNNIIKNISNLSKKSISIDTIKNCSVSLLNYAYINPTWTSYFSKIIKINNIDYIVAINETFGYYEHQGLQVLEINSTDNICFGIIYGDIELNDKTYNNIISSLKPTILDEVKIPKFSILTKLRYKNLLKETDLKTVFIDLKCPYIFKSECEISDCLQNIEFHFTENSIKTNKLNSIKTTRKFIIEKSFRFYIRTKENVVLFFGSY
jgi:hypothetical protein